VRAVLLVLAAALLAILLAQGCSDAEPPDVAPVARTADDPEAGGTGEEGRYRPRRVDEGDGTTVEELEQVSYLSGSKPQHARTGVTIHDAARAFAGLNLYVSGHRPEAILMDMDGRVLHRWECTFERAFPDYPKDKLAHERAHWRTYFRRCHLFPNGDLLAIFEGHGLIKLDKDSNVLWAFGGGAHHDLDVQDDGTILVLTRTAHVLPEVNPKQPVLEDFVSTLDADGNETSRRSVLECFTSSDDPVARASLERMKPAGDLLHTNTIERLQGAAGPLAAALPAFRAGNLLISCLKTDTIAVIDPEAGKVAWAQTGPFVAQHQPTVLEDGRVLLLDNRGGRGKWGASRVLELDPATGEFAWTFEGTRAHPFETWTCGAAQRLSNGNTLVTESDNGRAFEVTRDGAVVWEFLSPHVAGPNDENVATLFEVLRLPREFPTGWIG
jgi:hypothetical protein